MTEVANVIAGRLQTVLSFIARVCVNHPREFSRLQFVEFSVDCSLSNAASLVAPLDFLPRALLHFPFRAITTGELTAE